MQNEFKDRIAAVIDDSGISKTKFAEKIAISPAFLSQMCSGVRSPSDRTISDICRKFHINENWLRTGEGEMKTTVDADQELADFFAEVYQAPLDDPCRRVIAVLQRINRNCPELFGEIVKAAEETVKAEETIKKEG